MELETIPLVMLLSCDIVVIGWNQSVLNSRYYNENCAVRYYQMGCKIPAWDRPVVL
jgi:hypothetical protein